MEDIQERRCETKDVLHYVIDRCGMGLFLPRDALFYRINSRYPYLHPHLHLCLHVYNIGPSRYS